MPLSRKHYVSVRLLKRFVTKLANTTLETDDGKISFLVHASRRGLHTTILPANQEHFIANGTIRRFLSPAKRRSSTVSQTDQSLLFTIADSLFTSAYPDAYTSTHQGANERTIERARWLLGLTIGAEFVAILQMLSLTNLSVWLQLALFCYTTSIAICVAYFPMILDAQGVKAIRLRDFVANYVVLGFGLGLGLAGFACMVAHFHGFFAITSVIVCGIAGYLADQDYKVVSLADDVHTWKQRSQQPPRTFRRPRTHRKRRHLSTQALPQATPPNDTELLAALLKKPVKNVS